MGSLINPFITVYTNSATDKVSMGYFFKNNINESDSYYKSRNGLDCIEWFMKELVKISDYTYSKLSNPVSMNYCSRSKYMFDKAVKCHICQKYLNDPLDKVRDHCPITGEFRGAAHSRCNLSFQYTRVIPVVFHNLSGYDSHFLIEKLVTSFKGNVSVLPVTNEKYISFTKTIIKNKNFSKEYELNSDL